VDFENLLDIERGSIFYSFSGCMIRAVTVFKSLSLL
jgi:hypothetical protein